MASSSFLQVKGLRKHIRNLFSSRTLLSPQMETELSPWKLKLVSFDQQYSLVPRDYLAGKGYLNVFFL